MAPTVGAYEDKYNVAPAAYCKRVRGYFGVRGSATAMLLGNFTPTVSGTLSAYDNGRDDGIDIWSASTAGASAMVRDAFSVHSYSGLFLQWLNRLRPNLGIYANSRFFFGLTQNAPTNTDPSTWLNTIGFGADAADVNISFMVNDGSGTATKIALTDMGKTAQRYDHMSIFCPAISDGRWIPGYAYDAFGPRYHVVPAAMAKAPLASVTLAPTLWLNNGISAQAVLISLTHIYYDYGWGYPI